MYRPRRTTEFFDEAHEGGVLTNKRQTRTLSRATVTPSPMPGKRNSSRQGRLGQPLSLERDRGTLLGPPSSARKSAAPGSNGATPLRNRNTTAERAVAPHTDKRWVQEQSQQIAEYIQDMLPANTIQGLTPDFFSRSTGLRQMSTKQFVGIVNFFFSHIWRNKITVGTNHVEDIMSALHKLNYPHQVNKSWLMTPTTQHSFGHVIVMLDFLKDFAPPSPSMQEAEGLLNDFPFMETTEQPSYVQNTADSIALSTTQTAIMLDEEVNEHIFVNAADGFVLWNNLKIEECGLLQRKTGDMLINKRCNLANAEALEEDISRQEATMQELERHISNITNVKREKQLEKLLAERQHLEMELESIQSNTIARNEETKILHKSSQQASADIKAFCSQLATLKMQVSQQKCTLQQFDSMKIQLTDLENEAAVHERQLRDITERSLSQQVMLSRAKKQLLDKVEQFNTNLRDIHYAGICSSSEAEALQLALPPCQSDIQKRMQNIGKLNKIIKKKRTLLEEQRKQLEEAKAKTLLVSSQLESEINGFATLAKTQEQKISQFELSNKNKRNILIQQQAELVEQQQQLAAQLEQLQQECAHYEEIMKQKELENNEFLSAAEHQQEEQLKLRTAFLDEYEELLTESEAQLKTLCVSLEESNSHLVKAKEQLASTVLPPIVCDIVESLELAQDALDK